MSQGRMVIGGTSKPNMALHRTPLRSAGELYRYVGSVFGF